MVGARKADALVSRGECALALLGPTGWKNQDDFWKQVPLESRTVVVVLDSNTTTDRATKSAAIGLKRFLKGRKATVKLIVLPADAASDKVGVDDYLAAGKTVVDLLALRSPDLIEYECGYLSMPDGLYRIIPTEKGESRQRLTNFPAKIIAELIVTDGVEETREFEIEAKLAGRTYRIAVKAAEFESMNWVAKKLGAQAVIFAGYGLRDHVRVAIQQPSGQIPKFMVYTHIGWVHHNGYRVFLHAGGAIGPDGAIGLAAVDPAGGAAPDNHADAQYLGDVAATLSRNVAADRDSAGEMEAVNDTEGGHRDDIRDTRVEEVEDRPVSESLAGKDLRISGTNGTIRVEDTCPFGLRVRLKSVLRDYYLPPPPTGDVLVRAVQASLAFLGTAPDHITIPLYAAIWRAVLGDVNFSLQLVGLTQLGKTVLAALLQQHFGAGMHAESLPAAWSATGNAIVATAFLAKDVLLTVDDLVFAGSRGDTDQVHRKAEMVLRAQGNRAGRARCRGDGTLIEGKAPRCLILSTGEDTPNGPSLNSRGLILPVGPADVFWDRITLCQGLAAKGVFAMAMAGFLQWMAKDYETIVQSTRAQVQHLHQVFCQNSASRTAMIAANLLAGLENFMTFARDCGAIEEAEFGALWERAHEALWEAIQSHKSDQDVDDPVQRFRDLLAEAFHSGRIYVFNRINGVPNICPEAWGWEKHVFVVPADKDNSRSYENMAEEQQAKICEAAEEVQESTETKELHTYRHRGEQVGWWDFNDNLYLLPKVTLAVIQRLAQANDHPLPVTSKTLGKLLDAKGKLKSKRAKRYTKQLMVGGAQVNVYHVDALWINPMNPDPQDKDKLRELLDC